MAKREYSEARARANKKYNDKHYWKLTLMVARELEAQIREKANGSVNAYVVDLIKKDLGITDTEKDTE